MRRHLNEEIQKLTPEEAESLTQKTKEVSEKLEELELKVFDSLDEMFEAVNEILNEMGFAIDVDAAVDIAKDVFEYADDDEVTFDIPIKDAENLEETVVLEVQESEDEDFVEGEPVLSCEIEMNDDGSVAGKFEMILLVYDTKDDEEVGKAFDMDVDDYDDNEEELKEAFLSDKFDYKAWGWITPEGKLFVPTLKDKQSESETYHIVFLASKYPKFNTVKKALKAGFIRWFVVGPKFTKEDKDILVFEFDINKVDEEFLKKGARLAEKYLEKYPDPVFPRKPMFVFKYAADIVKGKGRGYQEAGTLSALLTKVFSLKEEDEVVDSEEETSTQDVEKKEDLGKLSVYDLIQNAITNRMYELGFDIEDFTKIEEIANKLVQALDNELNADSETDTEEKEEKTPKETPKNEVEVFEEVEPKYSWVTIRTNSKTMTCVVDSVNEKYIREMIKELYPDASILEISPVHVMFLPEIGAQNTVND